MHDDQVLQPNMGYYLYKRKKHDEYLAIIRNIQQCSLRERAYVFWDAFRISNSSIGERLREAKNTDLKNIEHQYSRYNRKTVEERLQGVKIPDAQMERIEEEFGTIIGVFGSGRD
ncbi:hypothetical protein BX600DRAFT_72228 [Xylariales sp. PMI_506]|nr:hypothetical protein BX600DRAFT_72228 [Xylariales sp. PMI_506]